jgi:ABC-type oligopeptide transport system ATPase subunit
MITALSAEKLGKTFGGGKRLLGRTKPAIRAVEAVSFSVTRGETLGTAGESRCGKSTLARMLVGLLKPTSGSIRIGGRDLSDQMEDPAAFERQIQYVFQNPITSLNLRKTICAARRGGSASRGLWPPLRGSWCSTSQSRLSMCPCRRRSSTCSPIYGRNSTSPICSFRMIWRWWMR